MPQTPIRSEDLSGLEQGFEYTNGLLTKITWTGQDKSGAAVQYEQTLTYVAGDLTNASPITKVP